MREKIFRFKRFSVSNHLAAMKVGTDGVLLGAWCGVEGAGRILDVGTGTGLIALMAAQRNDAAIIHAVEIDPEACREAAANFERSAWSDRLTAHNADFRQFAGNGLQYDLIVSNPPYFAPDGLLPPDKGRTLARHGTTLTYRELITHARNMLSPQGAIALVTPSDVQQEVRDIAIDCNLKVRRITLVHTKPDVPPKRILWEITGQQCECLTDKLTIESEIPGQYTAEYISLTKDFYLKM